MDIVSIVATMEEPDPSPYNWSFFKAPHMSCAPFVKAAGAIALPGGEREGF